MNITAKPKLNVELNQNVIQYE